MSKKIIIGVTPEDEIYQIEIGNDRGYFSVTADLYRVVNEEQGEQEARDMLDDGEIWRMQVDAGNTELGKEEYNEYVLQTDGWQHMLDVTEEYEPVEIDGETYHLAFQAGGQHDQPMKRNEWKYLFISERSLELILQLWNRYHLKEERIDLNQYLLQSELKQNHDDIIQDAVKIAVSNEK